MKNSILIFLMLATFGCKKETPTTLELSVIDDNANPVNGANVVLFDRADFATAEPIATQKTNRDGVAIFDDGLKATKYYWLITGNCASNLKTTQTTVDPIAPNRITKVNTQILDEGQIWLASNSSNPYRVEVNGKFLATIAGYGAYNDFNFPVGTYTFKVTQLSGYIFSPTIVTYTRTVSKCNLMNLDFPN